MEEDNEQNSEDDLVNEESVNADDEESVNAEEEGEHEIGEEQGEDEINEHQHGDEVAKELEVDANEKKKDWHVLESPLKQTKDDGGEEKRE